MSLVTNYRCNGVISGLAVTSAGGLDVDVSAGVAVNAFQRITHAGESRTLPKNRDVYLDLTYWGSLEWKYRRNGVPEPRVGRGYLRLAKIATDATTVTITDRRVFVSEVAAATTPGTVTGKIEVFDSTGTSLGFIAVYNDIT